MPESTIDKIHVISHGNKWAVVKSGKKKASSLHRFRELAYHRAKQQCNYVVVHNKDGSVLFIDRFDEIS